MRGGSLESTCTVRPVISAPSELQFSKFCFFFVQTSLCQYILTFVYAGFLQAMSFFVLSVLTLRDCVAMTLAACTSLHAICAIHSERGHSHSDVQGGVNRTKYYRIKTRAFVLRFLYSSSCTFYTLILSSVKHLISTTNRSPRNSDYGV